MPPSPKIQISQLIQRAGEDVLLALSSAQPEKPEKNWLACFKYDHRVPSCMLMPAKPPQCFLSMVVTKPDYEDAMRSRPWDQKSQPHSQAGQAIPAKPMWPLSGCHLYWMFPNGRIIISYLEKSVLSALNGMSASNPCLQSLGNLTEKEVKRV